MRFLSTVVVLVALASSAMSRERSSLSPTLIELLQSYGGFGYSEKGYQRAKDVADNYAWYTIERAIFLRYATPYPQFSKFSEALGAAVANSEESAQALVFLAELGHSYESAKDLIKNVKFERARFSKGQRMSQEQCEERTFMLNARLNVFDQDNGLNSISFEDTEIRCKLIRSRFLPIYECAEKILDVSRGRSPFTARVSVKAALDACGFVAVRKSLGCIEKNLTKTPYSHAASEIQQCKAAYYKQFISLKD